MPTPEFTCPEYQVLCPGGQQCVDRNALKLCDGKEQCYDGSDESPEFCKGLYTFHVILSIFWTNKLYLENLSCKRFDIRIYSINRSNV